MVTRPTGGPRWRIFHPSDFSPPSGVAFAHALRLALLVQGSLAMLHVARDAPDAHWSEFPGVRATLARWGFLPEGSPPEAASELGIDVDKVIGVDRDPLHGIRGFLERHPPDLIVLATHQHHGVERWLHHAVAEPLARESGALTLFVPPGVPGFVSAESGAVSLRRLLIPVDREPSARPAINGAAALAGALGTDGVAFDTLHVGDDESAPEVVPVTRASWRWQHLVRPGDPVEEILRAAGEVGADLIAMTTRGHSDFLDALRGSTTERVVREARCPVLAIPAGTRRLEAMLARE